MTRLDLAFESKEASLSVRRFAVHEALSTLFTVSIEARSPDDDLDLEAIVGRAASFHLDHGLAFAGQSSRSWGGVCSHMELLQAEPTGLSTYSLRIVPRMWLLTQRRAHRLFQHASIPEIVGRLLDEHAVPHAFRVHRPDHPRLELRAQYGESDFDFVSRLLEEAGIAYFFLDHPGRDADLVLHDAPHTAEPRAGGPLAHVEGSIHAAEQEIVTRVRLAQQVRPGTVTLRDHDFHRSPSFKLQGRAVSAGPEEALEHYAYTPGAFLVEPEGPGPAHPSEKAGMDRARRHLESARASRRSVTFATNVVDLSPGTVVSIGGHSRSDLAPDHSLLVTELTIQGSPDAEWTTAAHAVFADHPHRPPLKTAKPAVQGLQSALVVGPPGEEIHTDEHGRVRVQFHWDREGKHDDHSSCWVRVSQGWAGAGHGLFALPRVGHEVLVAFLEGDPDHPLVVGRLHNATSPSPYELPQHRTRSGWKTASTPGSGGSNELMFEDSRGRELVYVHAERDLETVVKRNEAVRVGADRRTSIGAVDESLVGVRHSVTMQQGKGEAAATVFEMVDRRIRFSTGEASITLDGPDITLEAKGRIFLHSSHGDVELLGGPWVKINCGPVQEGESDTVTMHHVTGVLRDQDGKVLPDWTVVVKGSDGKVQEVRTDGSGKYFALVPAGKCEVSVPGGKRYGQRGVNLDHMDLEPEVFEDCGPV